MSERQCHYCKAIGKDLRPYGPGAAFVCFSCAFAEPERKTQTENAFGGLLEATSVFGPIQIGTDEGPVPFNPDVETDA